MNEVFEPTVQLYRPHTGSRLTVTLPRVEYNITHEAKGGIPKAEAEQSILNDMLPSLYPGWQLTKLVRSVQPEGA